MDETSYVASLFYIDQPKLHGKNISWAKNEDNF